MADEVRGGAVEEVKTAIDASGEAFLKFLELLAAGGGAAGRGTINVGEKTLAQIIAEVRNVKNAVLDQL